MEKYEIGIIVNEKNVNKIENVINESQRIYRVRNITVTDVFKSIDDIEKRLNVPKKYLEGITADVDIHAQSFAKCYNGIPQSTQFKLKYEKGKWRIIKLYRYDTRKNMKKIMITLTEECKKYIQERYVNEITTIY